LGALRKLPEGLLSAYRYSREYPNNAENTAFADAFNAVLHFDPTNWAWQNYVVVGFILEALKRTNGDTDGAKLAGELAGMRVKSPFGVDGTITMRDTDHTIIGYPAAWSHTIAKAPYLAGFEPVAWENILSYETEWKKAKGYV
jgi:branched-chain amino acid transport system substrate-binding protein